VWLVEEGIVLLFRALPSGNEAVLGLRFPGQLVDQCSQSPSASHQYSARTVSSCRLYRIDGDDFHQRVADGPRAAEFIQHLLRRDLRHLGCSLLDLKTQPIEARFCRCLLLLATALGVATTGPELRLGIPLRDEELAGLIGASARQFKRVKRRLQERGILRVLRPHELAIAVDRLDPNVVFNDEWRAHGG
jgi:CRP-like cAMP-binding protein